MIRIKMPSLKGSSILSRSHLTQVRSGRRRIKTQGQGWGMSVTTSQLRKLCKQRRKSK